MYSEAKRMNCGGWPGAALAGAPSLLLNFLTLKSLINEQGGYVVFLVLSEYSFIRDFRVF